MAKQMVFDDEARQPLLAGVSKLARAVAAQIVSAADADLIAVTRLEDVSVADYADRTGQAVTTVYKNRARAEARLAAAIRSGWTADPLGDVVREATMTTMPQPAGDEYFFDSSMTV